MATFIPGNSLFELYHDLAQQSSDFWTQALTMPRSFEPSENWQRLYDTWATFWSQTYAPSADVCQAAQKLWLEHLDTTSKGLERLMGENACGTAASKLFEDQVAWQQQMARAVKPQIDGVLRFANLPSRSQVDQLFERASGLEERFDDLEAESRQIRQILRMSADALGEVKQDLTALAVQLADMSQSQTTTDALGEVKQDLTALAVQLADMGQSQTTTDALGEVKQDLAALAAQLAGMNQHLEAIEARAARAAQPGAQPPAQPPRPRSRRKSPPKS